MKQGWEYKKLGEIGNIVTGSTPSTKDESNYSPREYCFVKPSDLPSQGIVLIEETEYYVSRKGLSKSRVLPTGSVLVSCIGSIGKIGILTKEACSNQQINAIIPKNDIDSKFIAYSIYAYRFLLESIANAPVVPIINKTDFSKIQIPLPPKSTQLSIVSELDKINELIRLKKEQLKDYDNLAQSIFYEMFGDPVENEKGWEVKTIKDTCFLKSGDSKANNSHKGDLPYVKVGDMNLPGNENYINISTTYVDRESNINRIFPIGTIIFPKRGGAILTNKKRLTNVEICCDLNTMGVIPGDMLNKYYLFQYFKILDLSTICSGSTVLQLNNCDINPLIIPLPPLPLQHLFAQRIEQIERQKSAVQKSITDLETLLASRMQYWFE